MWPDNGGTNQIWHFDEDFRIRSELGSVLDVKDGSLERGTPLIASTKHCEIQQKFRIVPVSE